MGLTMADDLAVLRGQAIVDAYIELRGGGVADRQRQVAEIVVDLVAWLNVKD